MLPEATARTEKDRLITAFTSSREIGNIACLRRTTSLRHPQAGTHPFRLPPSLKLVAFRGAGN
jgi:hypothetical protein